MKNKTIEKLAYELGIKLAEENFIKEAFLPAGALARMGISAGLGATTGAISAGEGNRMQGALLGGLAGAGTYGAGRALTKNLVTGKFFGRPTASAGKAHFGKIFENMASQGKAMDSVAQKAYIDSTKRMARNINTMAIPTAGIVGGGVGLASQD